MKWQGRERSSNIEDRRGEGGGGLGGGFGRMGGGGLGPIPIGGSRGGMGLIGLIVLLGIIWFVTKQNPIEILTGDGGMTGAPSSSQQWVPSQTAGQDELSDFMGVVVKDTENMWSEEFQKHGMTYDPPTVVLFSDATRSGCGIAQSASGPFYCPNDKKVYVDLTFYDQLRDEFGASGDFAQAYVIAHEIGHAVQDQTGVLPRFNQQREAMSQDQQNAYSVRVELQADCYAGVWANYANRQNYLEQGDVEEAINAANRIGDDTLTRGQVAPRNFTHGTSEQRMAWLQRGMQTGDVTKCDTFNASI